MITRKRAALAAIVAALTLVGGGLAASAVASTGASGSQINACGNPVLYSNLSGWGTLDNADVSRVSVSDHVVAQHAFQTSGSGFYMPQLPVTGGSVETFAFDAKASGQASVAVDWYAGKQYLGQSIGTPVAISSGAWRRVSAAFRVPSGATNSHPLGYFEATGKGLATACDYETGGKAPVSPPVSPTSKPVPPSSAPVTTPVTPPSTGDGTQAAVLLGWGTPLASESDEYNGTSIDYSKWGKFGAGSGNGCSAGFNGHGQRCGTQTTEGGGYATVTGTADGKTGGLYSTHGGFQYGRVEVRERAFDTGSSGAQYHAVPLLFPENGDYTHAEIDFNERDVGAQSSQLFVHHDGGQSQCSVNIDTTAFHNYAVDWEPGSVKWYVDGALKCSVSASITAFNASNGGLQMDMFPGTGTTMRPAQEQADWIRFYPSVNTKFD